MNYPEPICVFCARDLTDLPRLYTPFMKEWTCGTVMCTNAPKSRGQEVRE